MQHLVAAEVDNTHSSFTYLLDDAIMPEHSTDQRVLLSRAMCVCGRIGYSKTAKILAGMRSWNFLRRMILYFPDRGFQETHSRVRPHAGQTAFTNFNSSMRFPFSVSLRCFRVFRVIRGSFVKASKNTIHESHEIHERTAKRSSTIPSLTAYRWNQEQ